MRLSAMTMLTAALVARFGLGSIIASPPANPPIIARPAVQSPVQPVQPAYRTSNWSAWSRAEGVQYRYRWGWNPQESRYNTNVDAIYEVRNVSAGQWVGAVRSLNCSNETLSMSRSVTLKPNEMREVKFLTPNCGTKAKPYFRPNVVRSSRID